MYDQPRYEPLEASDFFADGLSARPALEGTIPRGALREDEPFYTGKDGGQLVSQIPAAAYRATYNRNPLQSGHPYDETEPAELRKSLLRRGRERFDIYCSVCHGRTGDGDGMIVRRGFRRPPSYHTDRLRQAPAGHFYDVIANGFGAMPSYANRIDVSDRWAIVAYIRAAAQPERPVGRHTRRSARQSRAGKWRSRWCISSPPGEFEMTPSSELIARLHRLRLIGLIAAIVAGALCAYGYVNLPQRFYPAYLTAFMYWLGMAIGCLVAAMVHGLTGGAWGRAIGASLRRATRRCRSWRCYSSQSGWEWRIYEWADPEIVRENPVLARKAGFLNGAGFQVRAILYFAIWIAILLVLNFLSPNDDRHTDSPRARRLQTCSGLGLIAFAFTFTLAAVDWLMSLEPEWYSTMYGLIHMAGQAVSGLSLGWSSWCAREFEPGSQIVTSGRLNDLGSLLLASVMFWAYVSFFQYLVIWSGNLPEENVWYVHLLARRLAIPGIGTDGVALCSAFPAPALPCETSGRRPASAALPLLLVMRYVDLYWMIVPGFQRGLYAGAAGFTFHWLDLAALVTIGGLWLSGVCLAVVDHGSRLPMYDPEFMRVRVDERTSPAAVA